MRPITIEKMCEKIVVLTDAITITITIEKMCEKVLTDAFGRVLTVDGSFVNEIRIEKLSEV